MARPGPRIPRDKVLRPKKEPRPGDSKAHLRFVASLPCCICGAAAPSEYHHLMGDLKPGLGLKSEDRWTVPLCGLRHHIPGVHAHGNDMAYLMQHGIDGKALATALWRVSGDLDAGLRLIDRAHQDAALKQGAA